ncbi:phenylalanine--tRNA ligase subunit beta [Marivibrio halodurans]|uniref:Phenylalanine--tRNA ligase beta subunit n=1 Tax=Marivibrio halodurans TaxID=2039722 RepID=A0A8J7S0G2_9PROT|nr:phenylalanine--tRNA ligase subunit beta [Marivibrio halodurans]MBP5858035.1 phenylalanine--tRNA ligase subunit beta [Marivibrio halodurans]
MKFTLSWLKEHLETEASLDEITTALTDLGLEVEGVENPAEQLAPFLIAHVTEAKPHPNADRLQICMVDAGDGKPVQVICGAPNARAGMKGVFAPAGAYVPGTDLLLKAGKIRGEESNGMLCSEREMGLSEDHDGIIDLPADAPVGAGFAAWKGLDDPVIEIAITPNRGDCLGVHGIARDLAARGLGRLKPFDATPVPGTYPAPIAWARAADIGDDCPYVAGRHFRGVRNGPSPDWLQKRLKAIGLRPISALVDITNLVTHDLGRPLHVFDAAKVKGETLTMAKAEGGEEILALDGRTYRLEAGMTVIVDGNGPQGIGGIMGGELSGCTEETTKVFLEAALFDPTRVAETGRKLGIDSDARYRFERGVDPASVDWAVEVAARLILELCGGEASEITRDGAQPDVTREITLNPAKLKSFGGADVPGEEAAGILERLGFKTRIADASITAVPPTWRPDIEHEHCLIEEVLRVHGFDAVPAVSLVRADGTLPQPILTLLQRRTGFAKRTLATRGMLEAVTWSFMPRAAAERFGGGDAAMQLANPISADLDAMRPSILPNLLSAARRNIDRGHADPALFEAGPAFRARGEDGQDLVVAGLRAGKTGPRHWAEAPRDVDAFDAKADVEAVLAACGAPVDKLQVSTDAPDWYHPGRSGCLRLGPKVLARFGEVHPGILRDYEIRGRVAAFEIFLEAIPEPKAKKSTDKAGAKTRPLLKASTLQPVTRDFAFLVDADVPADKILRAALGADKQLVAAAGVFDIYQGAELEGRKSVAISVTLQPVEKTLTDKEIEAVAARIVANVGKQTGASLRA